MAIYGMVFEGTIALAAAIWGFVAEHLGVRVELLIGAAALLRRSQWVCCGSSRRATLRC
jgi:hypothetical protein